MRRIVCFLIAVFCIIPMFSYADTNINLETMSEDELLQLIKSAKEELKKRTAGNTGDIVLYDDNGIKVYMNRKFNFQKASYTDEYLVYYECVMENNSTREVCLYGPNCSVNDWEAGNVNFYADSGFEMKADAGKKVKGKFCVSTGGTDVTKYAEIEEIEFTLGLYYDGRSIYSNSPNESKPIHLEIVDRIIYLK